MAEQKATNVHWHHGEVTRDDRYKLLGHKGATLWFTGLSGSGKSTVAVALEQELTARGKLCYRLDGDNVRLGINKNLGFSAEDRAENIRRAGSVAELFADAGVIVVTAFISPYRADRDKARAMVPEGRFVEAWVATDIAVCEERDPKGLYKKARAGQIKGFTGIDDPYEAPTAPELVLDTKDKSVDASAAEVIEYLVAKGFLA